MGRKIVVTSGKGGVGKTTVTSGLGIALSDLGHKVCMVDADIGLNNLDVVMCVENLVVYDILESPVSELFSDRKSFFTGRK